MDSMEMILAEFNSTSLIRAAIHSSPFWGLVIFLFKYYFKRMKAASDRAEARLQKIEDKLELLILQNMDSNPKEVQKKIEAISQMQKQQAVEIEAHWEAIKDIRRAYLT